MAWGGNMANPKEYIAIIAEAMDQEIESSEELVQMYRDDNMPEDSSVFRFELESGDYDVAYLVAQGYFFMNDWSADGTVSYVGPVSEVE
jgi:hypothetical protein